MHFNTNVIFLLSSFFFPERIIGDSIDISAVSPNTFLTPPSLSRETISNEWYTASDSVAVLADLYCPSQCMLLGSLDVFHCFMHQGVCIFKHKHLNICQSILCWYVMWMWARVSTKFFLVSMAYLYVCYKIVAQCLIYIFVSPIRLWSLWRQGLHSIFNFLASNRDPVYCRCPVYAYRLKTKQARNQERKEGKRLINVAHILMLLNVAEDLWPVID